MRNASQLANYAATPFRPFGHLAAYYLLPSACWFVGLLVVVLKHSWANI